MSVVIAEFLSELMLRLSELYALFKYPSPSPLTRALFICLHKNQTIKSMAKFILIEKTFTIVRTRTLSNLCGPIYTNSTRVVR